MGYFLYCTGDPRYKGWLPKGVKHPYTILKGITQGVREGGNESQIPTLGGGLITDPRFIAKILVYCGTIGERLEQTGKSHRTEIVKSDCNIIHFLPPSSAIYEKRSIRNPSGGTKPDPIEGIWKKENPHSRFGTIKIKKSPAYNVLCGAFELHYEN